ncbi:DoxX family protein [Lewinella sp. LCG006]|uniref:DoxX family protein n=1 Tax=Lewinella sp. LCG006 TaxID=3231911 RepID=UPI0034614CC3
MTITCLFSLILMATVYIVAGITHFRIPKFFLSITPKWVPAPEVVNKIVGAGEILLGVFLFFPATRTYAAIGIIVLLIAVFPANVYHFQKALKKQKMVWVTALRLPVQLLLIYWAYSFV